MGKALTSEVLCLLSEPLGWVIILPAYICLLGNLFQSILKQTSVHTLLEPHKTPNRERQILSIHFYK